MLIELIQSVPIEAPPPAQNSAVAGEAAGLDFAALLAALRGDLAAEAAEAEPETDAEGMAPEAEADSEAVPADAASVAQAPLAVPPPAVTVQEAGEAEAAGGGVRDAVQPGAAAQAAPDTEAAEVDSAPPVLARTQAPAPAALPEAGKLDPAAALAGAKTVQKTEVPSKRGTQVEADTKFRAANAELIEEAEAPELRELPVRSLVAERVRIALLAQREDPARADEGHAEARPISASGNGSVPADAAAGVAGRSPELNAAPTAAAAGSDVAATPRATLEQAVDVALKSVRQLVERGGQSVTVRLIPESLGELRLEVRSVGDEISVRMHAANAAVRDTLEAHAHLLRETLTRDGYSVVKVEVSAGLAQSADGGGAASREAQQDARSGNRAAYGGQDTGTDRGSNSAARASSAHDGALNLYA